MITPWMVESAIQQRSATSGTQNVIARSIDVLPRRSTARRTPAAATLVTTLTGMNPSVTIADPNTAIGFLAADALQHPAREDAGRWRFAVSSRRRPTTPTRPSDQFDKRNVRDGHYLAWGYEHLIVKLDATTKSRRRPRRTSSTGS